MTIISKTAGILSLTSCAIDMHKNGLIASKNAKAKISANTIISNSIGSQKTNYCSYKDSQIKNWIERSNCFLGLKEVFASIKGYISGFAQTGLRYIPNIALASVALLAKNSKSGTSKLGSSIANIAAVGLAAVEGLNFINNSTNYNEKKDYLNIK